MSVLRALYDTYNIALKYNLVDRTENIDYETVLLPVYHTNKKSDGNNIVQITLTSNGEFIKAEWIPKDKYIIYPVTENSINRTSGIAAHPLCDELAYLSKEIDKKKHSDYLDNLNQWADYVNKVNMNETFNTIYNYVIKKTILQDVIKGILGNMPYKLDDKYTVHYLMNNKEKKWDLGKTFITFIIENQDSIQKNLSVTIDKKLHENYISYVRSINKEQEQKYCDISNEYTYCTVFHRGIMGSSKLISISNNNETYYGRLSSGEEIISIGYETSQKIHLMLKYFLENKNNSRWLGESSYLVSWFSDDISNKEDLQVINSISIYSDNFIDKFDEGDVIGDDIDDDLEDEEESVSLGELSSKRLNNYLIGNETVFEVDSKFFIMIVDKISNGRVSIKYFRELPKSDLYMRVKKWYQSTKWPYYYFKDNIIKYQSPFLYSLVDHITGIEVDENNQTRIRCQNKKLRTKTIERLIPCIMDNKKIPLDLVNKMYSNICKRSSYKNTWDSLVQVACSIFKKYHIDHLNKEEVKEVLVYDNATRSYLHGCLLAVYEKIELDAMAASGSKESDESGSKVKRSTNAERLWTVYTRVPERTLKLLEDRIRPYKERLQKNKPGLFIYYDRLIGTILSKLFQNDKFKEEINKPVDEEFIFGYYAQKQYFYKKRSEIVKENDDNKEEYSNGYTRE